jgi:hypothetical protein
MVLGDGNLQVYPPSTPGGRSHGYFRTGHSETQKDYLQWKADWLKKVFNCPLRFRKIVRKIKRKSDFPGSKTFYYISKGWRRFKSWRVACYPGGSKDCSKILKWIHDPVFATAVWLMDDGGINSTNTNFPCIRLHTSDQSLEIHHKLVAWFKKTFGFGPRIHKTKSYYCLTFGTKESRKIWEIVRHIILPIPSMNKKFRAAEKCRASLRDDDIVHAEEKSLEQHAQNTPKPNSVSSSQTPAKSERDLRSSLL